MAHSTGGNNEIGENTLTKFKDHLLPNQLANFKQIWHKASSDDEESKKGYYVLL